MSVANIKQFRFTQPLTVPVFHRINTRYRNLSSPEPKSPKFSTFFVNLTHLLKFFKHTARLFISALPTFICIFTCVHSVYTKRTTLKIQNFTQLYVSSFKHIIIVLLIVRSRKMLPFSFLCMNTPNSQFLLQPIKINNVTYQI